jgi:hypothetical protein
MRIHPTAPKHIFVKSLSSKDPSPSRGTLGGRSSIKPVLSSSKTSTVSAWTSAKEQRPARGRALVRLTGPLLRAVRPEDASYNWRRALQEQVAAQMAMCEEARDRPDQLAGMYRFRGWR